jgi:PIN domain nuclease of toxin-antitoxin system
VGSRPAVVVLDTHAWLWWAAAEQELSEVARSTIAGADSVGVSSISGWEVVMLAARRRIEMDEPPEVWVRRALALERVAEIPVDAEIAMQAARLEREGFHRDPVDMIVYATARLLDAPLVTKDRRIRAFEGAVTVW